MHYQGQSRARKGVAMTFIVITLIMIIGALADYKMLSED